MNRTLRVCAGLILLGIYGVFLPHAVPAAEPVDSRLEKILADWQKRQNAVQSIDYQVEGEMKVPKGAYTKLRAVMMPKKKSEAQEAPAEDLSGPARFNLLLDFAKERFRLEGKEQSFHFNSCKLLQQVTIHTFDGKEVRGFMPRGKNPSLGPNVPEMGVVSGNVKRELFLVSGYPIFFAHGRIHTPREPIVPGQMRNKPDPNYLYIHGTVAHEGRCCLIVRTQTLQMGGAIAFEEYWVDPERDSTIVRYDSYGDLNGKKPTCNQDIVIHYKNSSNGWFPSHWRCTDYEHGKVLYYQEMRVTKMSINPTISDADFRLEIHPGMIVEEVKRHPSTDPFAEPKSDVSLYRLEEDGNKTYLPHPFLHPRDRYHKDQPRHNLLPWFLFTTAVILISLWFWVRYRSKKRRSSGSP